MTSRYWLITVNNPEKTFEEYENPNLSVLVGQLEKGENGTAHHQLYAEFKNPVRLGTVKSTFPRGHAEQRRGTRGDAIKYCTKDESREDGPWYRGISIACCEKLISGGNQNQQTAKLLEIKEKIKNGINEEEIASEHFELWVRYYRAFERYRCLTTKPRNHEMNVVVLQGPTGTGKSRWALEQYPGAYWKQRSNWWDNYSGHETVIIDEFYGWLPFDLLLRLCDRYPLLVESKGGQLQMVAKNIIITSNSIPSMWYKSCYFDSFIRRVNKWRVISHTSSQEFDNYPDALNIMENH